MTQTALNLRAFAGRVFLMVRTRISRAPARIAISMFMFAILIFTTLLKLPISTPHGVSTSLPDAFFTAVSAVTVTGLTVVDTGKHWTLFGEVVILAAIQTGALGVVTIALLLSMAVTRKLGIAGRIFARENIGSDTFGDVKNLLRVVVIVTLSIEGAIAAFLVPAFIHSKESFIAGLWHGIFYSISAFGNAGFTLHGGLDPFADNPFILTPIAVGVFIGSFGFPVFLNLIRAKWTRRKWTLHTKLTLITTTILLIGGALGWLLFEWGNPGTIGGDDPINKLGHAVFASTMLRSGGFSIVDVSASTSTTMLMSDALMFVGGGSASTAGGIKVTTLAVMFLAILTEARGTQNTNTHGRRIPHTTLRLAISVVFLGATLVLLAAALLTLVSDAPLDRILFEVISAFSTCGLSTGLASELGTFGKIVFCGLMLAGRVGPIALASALALRQRPEHYSYPEERPIIG